MAPEQAHPQILAGLKIQHYVAFVLLRHRIGKPISNWRVGILASIVTINTIKPLMIHKGGYKGGGRALLMALSGT